MAEARLKLAEMLLGAGAWDDALTTARAAAGVVSGESFEWRSGHAQLLIAESLAGLGHTEAAAESQRQAREILERTLREDDPLRQRAGGATP